MEKKDALKRLAFIRYLHNVAARQSEQPEPLAQASILTFHDSVELFLSLAADSLDIKDKITEFKDYWSRIDKELEKNGNRLGQKRAMTRLNASRVDLKHHGIMPSKDDVQDFRPNVHDFFESNTPIVFGFEYKEASMLYLITNDAVKGYLIEAQKLKDEDKLIEAMGQIAVAFEKLMDDFEEQLYKDYQHSPFLRRQVSTNFGHFEVDTEDEISGSLSHVAEAVEELQDVVRIIGLGIKYRDYVQFKMLVPYVQRTGTDYMIIDGTLRNEKVSMKYFDLCFQFVVEAAVHLQTLKLTVPPSVNNQQSLADLFKWD